VGRTLRLGGWRPKRAKQRDKSDGEHPGSQCYLDVARTRRRCGFRTRRGIHVVKDPRSSRPMRHPQIRLDGELARGIRQRRKLEPDGFESEPSNKRGCGLIVVQGELTGRARMINAKCGRFGTGAKYIGGNRVERE